MLKVFRRRSGPKYKSSLVKVGEDPHLRRADINKAKNTASFTIGMYEIRMDKKDANSIMGLLKGFVDENI
jgi:hypothetical protein